MALEVVGSPPSVSDYTLLSEHQEQTPGTFFGGKPVLHAYSPGASVRISRAELELQPVIASLKVQGGEIDGDSDEVLIDRVDVWVTSRNLILFSTAKNIGAQILYPTITIHAQEGSAVLLGLNLSDANTADEDLVFLQLRIIPTSIESHDREAGGMHQQQPNGDGAHAANTAQALFKAISDCQELNPDAPEDGDEEPSFDETAPGATGWITSENMQNYLDENGEFRMPEGATVIDGDEGSLEDGMNGLGEGAGRTRTAAELDAADGAEDDTKWQRTG